MFTKIVTILIAELLAVGLLVAGTPQLLLAQDGAPGMPSESAVEASPVQPSDNQVPPAGSSSAEGPPKPSQGLEGTGGESPPEAAGEDSAAAASSGEGQPAGPGMAPTGEAATTSSATGQAAPSATEQAASAEAPQGEVPSATETPVSTQSTPAGTKPEEAQPQAASMGQQPAEEEVPPSPTATESSPPPAAGTSPEDTKPSVPAEMTPAVPATDKPSEERPAPVGQAPAPSPGPGAPQAPGFVGPPFPGMPPAPAPVPGAPATSLAPGGPPASPAGPTALPPPGPQAGAEATEGERRLVFNFKFQPWEKVLQWLAEQAGLSLVMEGPPHGTFNYSDRRAYTVAEAIDLINSVLLTKGYVLVRRGQMLILVNLQDGVPPNLVPIVPESELDKRGEHELVSTIFSLSRLSVDEAQQEIRSLLGPQGSVVVLPKAQQLLVTDTAGRLRMIRDVLMRADSPEGGIIEAMQIFTLKYVTPDEAIAVLRQLLGIPADQFIAPDGSLRLAVDTVGMRIFAAGRSPRVRQVADILQAIDIPGPEGSARGAEGALQLEVYEVAPADPQTVLQVMQTLLAGSPGVRLTTDSKTGNLIALARPSEHATIRATLDQLRQQGTRLEVIPLRRLDPQVAATTITKLLAGQDGSSAVKVEVDSLSRQLLVRGTERDLTLVRGLLEKMGEGPGGGQSPTQAGTVRVLPIYGTQARQVIERLQQIWPTLRGNTLRVVGTPSFIQSRTPAENPAAAGFQGVPAPAPGGYVQPYPGWGPDRSAGWPEGWPEVDLRPESPPGPKEPPGKDQIPEGPPPAPQPMPLGPPEIQTWPLEPGTELQPPSADIPFMPVPVPPPGEEPLTDVRFEGTGGWTGGSFLRHADLRWNPGTPGRPRTLDSVVHLVSSQDVSAAVGQGTQQAESPSAAAGQAAPDTETPSVQAAPGEAARRQVPALAGASEQQPPTGVPGTNAPVVIAPGPSGLVIASEDQEALDLLEELVRMISSQVGSGPQLTIFYLKHARADAVAEVLDQVFGGGTLGGTTGSGAGGSMVRDLASAAFGEIGGGIVSSLLGGGGTITPSGTLRITPDTRLNALIVQATPTDLEIIEQLLQVLDQKESPEEVLAQPRPRVVPVRNMQASEVAEIVRQVYQDRLITSSGQQARGGPPNPQEFMQMLQALRGGRGGPTSRRGSAEQTQRLSIGVDTRTNSVIVVAPEPLFQEVKQLIEELDAAAAKPPQATQVVVVKRANPEAVQQAVRAMLGDSVTIGRSTPGGTSSTGSSGGTGSSSGGFDRSRFFRSGTPGGPPGGFGFPGGGPGFFGRGSFGGFGPPGGGFTPPSGTGFSSQSGRSSRTSGRR